MILFFKTQPIIQKVAFALVTLSALMTFNVTAKQQNYEGMHKQLNIMNNILKSSLQTSNKKGFSVTSVSSLYLQGQGVVFTINANSAFNWSSRDFGFVVSDIFTAPQPPAAPTRISENFDVNYEENFTVVVDSAEDDYQRAIEVFEKQRESSNDLRSAQRDLHYELRDIQRESKDLEYQLRHVNKEEKTKLSNKLKSLKTQKLALEKSRVSLEKKAKTMKKQHQDQKIKQTAQRKTNYKLMSKSIVETLCLYGNGLKVLPKNEHVSLIIKNAGDKNGRGYRDNILVFNKKDINDCSSDKINVDKLLTKANKYQF
ncbi:MAG: hypothetical protein OCD00_04025 [Colwellia sp.]